MNGRISLILVLLTVFAFPLLADHTLGNTVSEALSNSIENKEEKGSDLYMTVTFEIVAVKPDEIVIPLPEEVDGSSIGRGNNKNFQMNIINKYIRGQAINNRRSQNR